MPDPTNEPAPTPACWRLPSVSSSATTSRAVALHFPPELPMEAANEAANLRQVLHAEGESVLAQELGELTEAPPRCQCRRESRASCARQHVCRGCGLQPQPTAAMNNPVIAVSARQSLWLQKHPREKSPSSQERPWLHYLLHPLSHAIRDHRPGGRGGQVAIHLRGDQTT